MKNTPAFVLPCFILFFLMALNFNMHAQSWVQKADLPSGRWRASGFAIGDKCYISGGFNTSANVVYYKDLWEYDPVNDAWTQQADVPGMHNGYVGAVSFVINGKGYVALGIDVSQVYIKELWEYDPAGDTWLRKADLPAAGREDAACFVVNDKAYVIGGAGVSEYADVWQYDPATDVWSLKGSYLGGSILSPAAFSINGKGYVTCGYMGNTGSKHCYEYDPLTNHWTRKADFPGAARQGHVSFSLHNIGYCGLGRGDTFSATYKDFYSYDPLSNIWTNEGDFPQQGNSFLIAVSNGTAAYIGGGYSNGGTKAFYEFTSPDLTGLRENAQEPSVVCYPNPASDRIYLKHINIKENTPYSLYDHSARLVLKGQASENSIGIDCLSAGSYILDLGLKGQNIIRRITIEK